MKNFGANPGLLRKIHRNYKVARHEPKIWLLDSLDIGYVKITKVASSSFELMLTNYLHGVIGGQPEADIDKYVTRGYADQYARHINPKKFTEDIRPGFVFSFVSNPLDRLYSSYKDKILDERPPERRHNIFWNHDIDLEMTFDEFVRRIIEIPDHKIDRHIRSQAWCLWDGSELVADYIGKFENIARDWKTIADRYGFPELPHKNKSSRPTLADPYSKETALLVAERYKDDIRLFGYEQDIKRRIDSL